MAAEAAASAVASGAAFSAPPPLPRRQMRSSVRLALRRIIADGAAGRNTPGEGKIEAGGWRDAHEYRISVLNDSLL